MCKTFSFKVTSGVDSAARVLTTLRRKQFLVKEFSMTEIDSNNSQLKITLEDSEKLSVESAVLQMQKLVDVYDVKII